MIAGELEQEDGLSRIYMDERPQLHALSLSAHTLTYTFECAAVSYTFLPASMKHASSCLVAAILLCQTVHAQITETTGLLLAPEGGIEVLNVLDIDTSTLPTFLAVASGTVPEFTGTIPALLNPTGAAEVDDIGDGDVLEATTERVGESRATTPEEAVTEITTTLLTVANGSTTASALTTTVPASLDVDNVPEDEGSALPGCRGSLVVLPSLLLLSALITWS